MINIQNKSNFQLRTDYSDVYSHYYQLHDYKVKSAAIYRKTLQTSNKANDHGKLPQITSMFSNHKPNN